MNRFARRLVLLVALVVSALFSSVAEASSFEVNPVRVKLSAASSSQLLTLTNRSNEVVRVQAIASAWSQTPTGEMVLAPTTDVVFFPSMLTLKPGEKRKIRVGSATTFDAVEKTYRIFLEELPPLISQAEPGKVRVLTRMGLPVFVQPAAPKPAPRVEGLAVHGHNLSFVVKNGGNAFFMPQTLKIVATDARDQIVFSKSLAGWYVLAGGERRYVFELPKAACSPGTKIGVAVAVDTLTVGAALNAVNCAP